MLFHCSVKFVSTLGDFLVFHCFRFVTLDGPLSDLLLSKGETVESFRWDELVNRCQSKMGPAYQITFPGKQPALKKGKPDPVVINVVQRAGNKKVLQHRR